MCGGDGTVRNKVGCRDILLVGRTSVDARLSKGLPVRVISASNRVQRVRKCTEAGMYEAVECAISGEKQVGDKSVESKDSVPEHLASLYERSKQNLTDVFSKNKNDMG